MQRAGAAPGLSLEHALHPVQVWLILPLFALANAGSRSAATSRPFSITRVSLGIIAGSVVGKPLGTPGERLAVKSGLGALPEG